MRALSSSISAFRDLARSLSESGRTISGDGESGAEWRGPKCYSLPSLFPLPSSLFRRRLLIPALRPVRCEVLLEVPPMFPAILQQRVPFISLISFPTVKSRLPFFPRLQSSFRGRLQSLPPSLPPSLHSCMPPQCDAPRHFESENGVRIRGISQLRR